MIFEDELREISTSQKSQMDSQERGISRESIDEIDLVLPHIQILSGIRRCGKSTLLSQIMDRTKDPSYFNFEDPRAFGFDLGDFSKLEKIFGDGPYFFDEIQNVKDWESAARFFADSGKKIIITGSNASLLSKELGTKLTGRHITHELFPFSYKEYLRYTKKSPEAKTFGEYLEYGGFPQNIKYKRLEILQSLFKDIIERDIIVRHGIRSTKKVYQMAIYLLSNVGCEFSHNKLAKTFEFGSANSATTYVSYLEDSYLLFTIPKYDHSLKKQLINPKKVYAIDSAMIRANTISPTKDIGGILENTVYIQLRRGTKDIYYHKGKKECDFLIKVGNKISQAIQVCHKLENHNKKREIEGLIEAMDEHKLKQGYIITHNQKEELKIENKHIHIIPAWKWMTQ